jgi:hypothetical protein
MRTILNGLIIITLVLLCNRGRAENSWYGYVERSEGSTSDVYVEQIARQRQLQEQSESGIPEDKSYEKIHNTMDIEGIEEKLTSAVTATVDNAVENIATTSNDTGDDTTSTEKDVITETVGFTPQHWGDLNADTSDNQTTTSKDKDAGGTKIKAISVQ